MKKLLFLLALSGLQASIRAASSANYSQSDPDSNSPLYCSICLDTITPEKGSVLQCMHKFHTACMDQLPKKYTANVQCPNCKKITKPLDADAAKYILNQLYDLETALGKLKLDQGAPCAPQVTPQAPAEIIVTLPSYVPLRETLEGSEYPIYKGQWSPFFAMTKERNALINELAGKTLTEKELDVLLSKHLNGDIYTGAWIDLNQCNPRDLKKLYKDALLDIYRAN